MPKDEQEYNQGQIQQVLPVNQFLVLAFSNVVYFRHDGKSIDHRFEKKNSRFVDMFVESNTTVYLVFENELKYAFDSLEWQ